MSYYKLVMSYVDITGSQLDCRNEFQKLFWVRKWYLSHAQSNGSFCGWSKRTIKISRLTRRWKADSYGQFVFVKITLKGRFLISTLSTEIDYIDYILTILTVVWDFHCCCIF